MRCCAQLLKLASPRVAALAVKENPQPSVCRNKLMWQHPNHCIHMLIGTQVTPTVISPQGLSPSKLAARPLFLCL